MHFEYPWVFLLLLLPAALAFTNKRNSGLPSVSFSSLASVLKAGKSIRQYLLWLPKTLIILAMILLITAAARPQKGEEIVASSRSGVAIEMLLDISSSMDIGLQTATGNMSRIDAAKQVFTDFILGNDDDLPGRENDVIGLITFARYADTACPMTTGFPALTTIVDELEIEDRPNEDGTAYGDSLVLAAARLMKIDETIKSRDSKHETIKSKIIILLTDGENNCGKHLPAQASALAREWGIKVYAIFLGNKPMPANDREQKLTETQKELLRICDRTGGICRMVYDYDSLKAVYAEIDALEKSELNLFTDLIYKECFQWFTFAALLCLALGMILDSTVLRRIP
jgi:Ca-activated chloride channel family protein